MRQVPRYLLIGNGRVAQHFKHYLSLLSLPYGNWQRKQPILKLEEELAQATHVLLLINDQAIQSFAHTYLKQSNAILIHFSGSLVTEDIYGAHPLFPFSHSLCEQDQYQSIPFVIDDDAPSFANLLPGLPNPHVRLAKKLKAKYHALCVLSGNFSCLLWQKLFTSLEQEFALPSHIAFPYLMQATKNLLSQPKTALTGPLVRGDTATIEKNKQALTDDPFLQVYQSFVQCYQQMKEVEHE